MSKQSVAAVLQHAQAGRFDQAHELCSSIVDGTPGDINVLCLLASILLLKKHYAESERLFREVLAKDPNHVEALNNLGVVQLEYARDLEAAERLFRKVIQLDPVHVKALLNIGNICSSLGQIDDAEAFYVKALSLSPDDGAALNNLGAVYVKKDQVDEAIKCYRKARKLLPNNVEILTNLIVSIYRKGDKDATIRLMDEILALPEPGVALFPVFSFAKRFCLWNKIGKIQDTVVKLVLDGRAILNSLETMNLDFLASPDISNQELYDIHRIAGGEIDKLRKREPYTEHYMAMQSTTRLKIGLLSPDFRQHAINVCLRGIINHYDRERFAVHCYSSTRKEDDITASYRSSVDAFVNVTDLTDSQLAERIHDDGIHFLIDLAGYTQHGRLGAMSYSPAPVQLLYLGYPYTSGLAAVDYFITDPYIDGPSNAPYFTEKQLRLPECFTSFDSLHEQEIDKVIAFQRNGYITFGSLTNTYKLNPNTIAAWSRVLSRVSDSKILLNHPNYDLEITRSSVLKEFAKHGVAKERVIIIWAAHPSKSHLRYYNDIDIILDTFPQTGGTTTLEAAWMGVPLVTLVGDLYHQRLSYTVISNIGIDVSDLIAYSETEFVDKAVGLAQNTQRLIELHQQIPESLKSSILCDPARLTRHMETALIEGWNRKFPNHPLPTHADAALHFVAIAGGAELAAPNTLDDLDNYVLIEQQGWLDPEYSFVRTLIQPGMHIVDVDAGIGVYAVPLAKQVTDAGSVTALCTSSSKTKCLLRSKAHNRLDNLHVVGFDGTGRNTRLDTLMAEQGLSKIDFVRMPLINDGCTMLQAAERFFTKHSPLVMLSIRDNGVIDLAPAAALGAYGYQGYRFIPGLNILIPWISEDELDAFTLNIFFCKPDMAAALQARGLLISAIEPLNALPTAQDTYWGDYLTKCAFAKDLLPHWADTNRRIDGHDLYKVSLNLFAQSQLPEIALAQRHACLQAAYAAVFSVISSAPNLPRLLSAARIFCETGKRELAVKLLGHILQLFEEGGDVDIDEPFLALSDQHAAFDPAERFSEWIFASVVEQHERWRVLSSFFAGEESLQALSAVKDTGFLSMDMERRFQLLQYRHGRSFLR